MESRRVVARAPPRPSRWCARSRMWSARCSRWCRSRRPCRASVSAGEPGLSGLPHEGLGIEPLLGPLDLIEVQQRRHAHGGVSRSHDGIEQALHPTLDVLLHDAARVLLVSALPRGAVQAAREHAPRRLDDGDAIGRQPFHRRGDEVDDAAHLVRAERDARTQAQHDRGGGRLFLRGERPAGRAGRGARAPAGPPSAATMVRASSPCSARWKLRRCEKSVRPNEFLSKISKPTAPPARHPLAGELEAPLVDLGRPGPAPGRPRPRGAGPCAMRSASTTAPASSAERFEKRIW